MSKTDREICEAATPGPWKTLGDGDVYSYDTETSGEGWKTFICNTDNIRDPTAEFIAHFNPAKISEMLDTIDAKDAEIERLRKELDGARWETTTLDAKLSELWARLNSAECRASQYKQERDEARKAHCQLLAFESAINENDPNIKPADISKRLGWDCFDGENNE